MPLSGCTVYGCQTRNTTSISKDKKLLFRFPTDPDLRELWLANIPNEYKERGTDLNKARVCEIHFPPEQIIRRDKWGEIRPKLVHNAIPTIYPGFRRVLDDVLYGWTAEKDAKIQDKQEKRVGSVEREREGEGDWKRRKIDRYSGSTQLEGKVFANYSEFCEILPSILAMVNEWVCKLTEKGMTLYLPMCAESIGSYMHVPVQINISYSMYMCVYTCTVGLVELNEGVEGGEERSDKEKGKETERDIKEQRIHKENTDEKGNGNDKQIGDDQNKENNLLKKVEERREEGEQGEKMKQTNKEKMDNAVVFQGTVRLVYQGQLISPLQLTDFLKHYATVGLPEV